MDITPLVPEGHNVIEKYGNGGFEINGKRYETSLLVKPKALHPIASQTPEDAMNEIASDHASLLSDQTEILIIGSGSTIVRPDATLHAKLKAHSVTIDVMDTGSACRTYSILLTEGRQVACLLIPV